MIRIGNASGFYGDRFSAMHEMLTGGELDVLTGDYLAELTMLILGRDLLKDPSRGYAKTFLRQLRENLALAKRHGVTIVANAGGLNPAGLAEAVRELAAELEVPVSVAHVAGDDLRDRSSELGLVTRTRDGRELEPLTANAYLGAWGIAEAVRAGADVVVTGRVTDASLVVGPAAARFGWQASDYDALAGAVVAGHVIECGAQATGGNFAFFTELTGHGVMDRPGFPIAEIHADGSSVITKHPGTGGAVTVDTVTAQLLYEIAGPCYQGPDVTARFDTIELTQHAGDRVGISGVRGQAPPGELKVCLNSLAGYRNEITFVLTGLDIEEKAALVRRQLTANLPTEPAQLRWSLARTDTADAATEEEASALLHCVASDPDAQVVGRAFTGAAIELALASYPGFHVTAPPSEASPYGVYGAAFVDATEVPHVAVLPDGSRVDISAVSSPSTAAEDSTAGTSEDTALPETLPLSAGGPTRRVPLGRIAAARSGDKGGDANLGVWVRSEPAWRWLAHTLTVDELRRLLPETADLEVRRYALPNLYAVNFVISGLLGDGVASQARFDPQAKALGEWLRARYVDVPEELL
ncbi:acyclic terpene utilization AtuA family protein [Haloechinothrix sp. LS1_15]|uniref:acyclic terpene utilization AtuA family protein n=1 Tax=Haloechinothrix sp. LS1_15 TaxID=2652248 RepID=UPI0029443B2F|nr:acyclic terpene utilization AtuA family protein [Haloechinothrix sp. LS1_15]MDV6014070.1 DUF1446 domain-containing protein [Haloechinothrix sp. LS1_15]